MQALLLILLLPVMTFIRGLVLRALWSWFIVERFAASPLSIGEAAGLALTVSFACSHFFQFGKDPEARGEFNVPVFLLSLFMPFFVLLIGWLVHLTF
jgi:hypothetical protein